MDTQTIQYRVAYRHAQERRKHTIRHAGKSMVLLAFIALASTAILRVSLLTYSHGEAGPGMFVSEVMTAATQLSDRANAASSSFNTKMIASIEQAQGRIVARDLAIADGITTASQETIAIATGAGSANASSNSASKSGETKVASKDEATAATQQSAKVNAQQTPPSENDKALQTKAAEATSPTIAALPDYRSKALPPARTQTGITGGYAFGQCTYYVASRRQVGLHWGNARTWMANAQAEGYLTGPIPVPGAVAWTPNGWYGHVAYVEQVEGDRVLISEMNFAGWNRVSQRWVAASSFGYIYGKPQ